MIHRDDSETKGDIMRMENYFNAIVVGAAAAALLSGCSRKGEAVGEAEELPPLPVKIQIAQMQPFEHRVEVKGNLEADENATISARTSGNLDEVFVDVGDEVVKGETRLFMVDPVALENVVLISERAVDTAKAKLLVAEASLKSAEASRKKAVIDADRYTRLREEDRVSANEYEQMMVAREIADAAVEIAEANIALAREQIASAEASLVIARRDLSDAAVMAPIDGTVNERFMDPGERVDPGSPVLALTGKGRVKAIAYLPSEYYSAVREGVTEFRLFVDGVDLGMHKVTAKTPAVDTRLRTFAFRGDVEVPEAVPGKMGTFQMVFEKRGGISVPVEAVLTRRNRKIVFVNENGVAVEKTVETGLRTDGRLEITKGLEIGDEVIIQGQTQLFAGRKVAPAAAAK